MGNALLLLTVLSLPLAIDGGRAQLPKNLPSTEEIVTRLTKANIQNRNRLRPYQVVRAYQLFAKEEAKDKSEIRAAIEFIPPAMERFNIQKADGAGFGEKIVRRILHSESQILSNPADTDISSRNYRFRFLRQDTLKDHACYVLEINPLRRETNLLRGVIWVDTDTYLLHRIEGEPAKDPSWWVHDIHVILDFGDVQGMWLQNGLSSTANVRLLGRHTLTARDVDYRMGGFEAGLRPNSSQNE